MPQIATVPIYVQVGGYRVGRNALLAFNASAPFGTLEIYSDRLVLGRMWGRYDFPRYSIVRLSKYRGLFSTGLRIEHSIRAYPKFVVFWARDFTSLHDALHANAFDVFTSSA